MTHTHPTIQDLLNTHGELLKTSAHHSKTDLNTPVTHISAADEPETNSLIFLSDASHLQQVLQAKPLALVIPAKTPTELYQNFDPELIILLSPNPKVAMALISKKYFAYSRINGHFTFTDSDIHPTAMIHPTVKIAAHTKVGPYAVIGARTIIGENCNIAAHAIIEEDCVLGSHCQIFSHATIGWKTQMGDGCVVQSSSTIGSDGFGYATDHFGHHHGIPHQGAVILGQHVHVGAGTQIDRGTYGNTEIGDQTKIDNLVHIAHNCKIGKSCLLTAGFMMAGSSEVGDFFVTGGASVVTGHIKVTNNVQIAGASVVHKHIDQPGSYGGYPLLPLQAHLKNTSSMGKLTEMRKDINAIMKKIGLK